MPNCKLIFILSCCLGLMGCVHVQMQPLAAYNQAMKLPGPDKPKIFIEETTKINSAMTAYAIIIANSTDASYENILRNIWWKAAELKADVVIIRDRGAQYAGSVGTGTYVGYGVTTSFSTPVYNKMRVFCISSG